MPLEITRGDYSVERLRREACRCEDSRQARVARLGDGAGGSIARGCRDSARTRQGACSRHAAVGTDRSDRTSIATKQQTVALVIAYAAILNFYFHGTISLSKARKRVTWMFRLPVKEYDDGNCRRSGPK
jgi:hypothetical protein